MNKVRQPWILRFAPLIALVLWAICTASVFLVSPDIMRSYGTAWLTAAVLGALYFTAGYTRYAKILVTDEQGDIHVSPEGLGLLSMSLGLLVVTSYLLVFRVINDQPAFVTPDMLLQYTVSAAIFIFCAFLTCGWALLWTVRHVAYRRQVGTHGEP